LPAVGGPDAVQRLSWRSRQQLALHDSHPFEDSLYAMPDQRTAAARLRRFASRARTLALLYLVALFAATHVPIPEGAVGESDKLYHFGGYFALTLLVLAGWELTIGVLEAKHYFALWLVGILYAAFDEFTQIPVGRDCDPNDWMMDVLGVVAGVVVFQFVRRALYRVLSLRGDRLSLGKP
jgi:VanZ family protein